MTNQQIKRWYLWLGRWNKATIRRAVDCDWIVIDCWNDIRNTATILLQTACWWRWPTLIWSYTTLTTTTTTTHLIVLHQDNPGKLVQKNICSPYICSYYIRAFLYFPYSIFCLFVESNRFFSATSIHFSLFYFKVLHLHFVIYSFHSKLSSFLERCPMSTPTQPTVCPKKSEPLNILQ